MGVVYKPLDGERVSRVWLRLLTDLRRDGVPFTINEGHRTYKRQWELVREKGVWSPTNKTGAARPSPFAPHIRTGRFDHALDMDEHYVAGFIEACRDRGIAVTRTVPGEPWHVEANTGQLLAYYRRRVAQILRRRRARRKKVAMAKPPVATGRRVNLRGLELIKRYEGCRLTAYQLPGEQYWTIGYGDYGPHVKPGQRITQAEADRRLMDRVNREFAPGVDRLLTTRINDDRFAALVSLAYNIGMSAFANSTVLRETNRRHFLRASAAFGMWVRGANRVRLAGLVRRRAAEARLFRRKP